MTFFIDFIYFKSIRHALYSTRCSPHTLEFTGVTKIKHTQTIEKIHCMTNHCHYLKCFVALINIHYSYNGNISHAVMIVQHYIQFCYRPILHDLEKLITARHHDVFENALNLCWLTRKMHNGHHYSGTRILPFNM